MQHYRAAVALEFQHILAGEGVRRRKVEQDALVDGFPRGVLEACQAGPARFWPLVAERFSQRKEIEPGQSHHADATAPGRGGNSGDGGARLPTKRLSFHPRSGA